MRIDPLVAVLSDRFIDTKMPEINARVPIEEHLYVRINRLEAGARVLHAQTGVALSGRVGFFQHDEVVVLSDRPDLLVAVRCFLSDQHRAWHLIPTERGKVLQLRLGCRRIRSRAHAMPIPKIRKRMLGVLGSQRRIAQNDGGVHFKIVLRRSTTIDAARNDFLAIAFQHQSFRLRDHPVNGQRLQRQLRRVLRVQYQL